MNKYFGIAFTLITFICLLVFSNKQNTSDKLAQGGSCEPHLSSHCELSVASVGLIDVRVKPYPFIAEQSHQIWLEAKKPIHIVNGELVGINMNMGKIPLIASQVSDTQIVIDVIPVSCINPNMQWRVNLLVQSRDDIFPISLDFEINE